MELSKLTEDRIIESAEHVFYQKGKAGTSMQDIADEAGITRTLLNYYFRSKEKLFEAVFRKTIERLAPPLAALLRSGLSMKEYLPKMIGIIIDTMIEHPQIPIFVLQELSANKERMPQLISEMGIDPRLAEKKFAEDPDLAQLPIDPRQVMLNVISLCIFPFAARPVVESLIYGNDTEAYLEAMRHRKQILPEMIMKSMKAMQS